MGQSKIVEGRDRDAFLDIYTLNSDDSQESFGSILFPAQRHLKGRSRLQQVKGRAGAIVALIMNPHEPEVVAEVRKLYSPEAQEYIPRVQAIGRSLLRLDWYGRVDLEELGLFNYESLMFYSSEEVADRMGMGQNLSVVEHGELTRLAVAKGRTIA